MKWASHASGHETLDAALDECAESLLTSMGPNSIDLAIVFISSHHLSDPNRIPNLLQQKLKSKHVVGCSAGGVIGGGKEIEQRPGISVTCGHLPEVKLTPFHINNEDLPDLDASPESWENITRTFAENDPQFIILSDPFTIQSENLLMGLDYAFPKSVKIGGLASGNREHGGNVLILDSDVYEQGALGIALEGKIRIDTIVAQGCRPIGRTMRITRSHQNILMELDGQPPLVTLKDLFPTLNDRDQTLAQHSLFLGMVMDEFEDNPNLGDFLIRNIIGMDSNSGALAIGEMLREGQLAQFHLRDAQTSSDELSALLTKYRAGSSVTPETAGALLFSCQGRGLYLYGHADHDTGLFHDTIGEVPLGGFFCNGEIGPVMGTTYLHGYTSSLGVLRPLES